MNERRIKTQQEQARLNKVQRELNQLEQSLQVDVNRLRAKIEEAIKDYTAAKTRFDAAEMEYISAKLDVQKKEDLKERMTEHLMIIIQENETRKAEKLQELMTKMALSEDDAIKAAEEQAHMNMQAVAMARAQLILKAEETASAQLEAENAAAAEGAVVAAAAAEEAAAAAAAVEDDGAAAAEVLSIVSAPADEDDAEAAAALDAALAAAATGEAVSP